MPQYPPPPPGYPNYQYPPPPFGGPSGYRPPPQHMNPPEGFQYPNYPPGMAPPRGYNGPSPSSEQQQKQPQQPSQQPPQPLQPQPQKQPVAAPPSPVRETKPDVTTATAEPTPIRLTSIQPTPSKPVSVVPAMPIAISIPIQPKPTKPSQPQTISPTTSPIPIAETAKVTTAADVQSLAKSLSETKLVSNTPGAGGYLTSQPRRRFPPRKIDSDYDFESANAKFNKEEVAKEVLAANNETPSTTTLTAALEEPFYDKGKSFFDNISCENKDRNAITQEGNPNTWKRGEERKLNMETFGQASVDGGRYGRGGYRGRSNWRGRGYTRGRGNWRGNAPRTNGQNESETSV
jgi:protein LSM14